MQQRKFTVNKIGYYLPLKVKSVSFKLFICTKWLISENSTCLYRKYFDILTIKVTQGSCKLNDQFLLYNLPTGKTDEEKSDFKLTS